MKSTVTFYVSLRQRSFFQSSYALPPGFQRELPWPNQVDCFGRCRPPVLPLLFPCQSPEPSPLWFWVLLPHPCLDTLSDGVLCARTTSFNFFTLKMFALGLHFLGTMSRIEFKKQQQASKTKPLFCSMPKATGKAIFLSKSCEIITSSYLFLLLKYFIIIIFSLLTKENRFNSHH